MATTADILTDALDYVAEHVDAVSTRDLLMARYALPMLSPAFVAEALVPYAEGIYQLDPEVVPTMLAAIEGLDAWIDMWRNDVQPRHRHVLLLYLKSAYLASVDEYERD